jgi:hypothetical protein
MFEIGNSPQKGAMPRVKVLSRRSMAGTREGAVSRQPFQIPRAPSLALLTLGVEEPRSRGAFHIACWGALDVDTDLPRSRGTKTHARLCGDARGRHGSVREELAA